MQSNERRPKNIATRGEEVVAGSNKFLPIQEYEAIMIDGRMSAWATAQKRDHGASAIEMKQGVVDGLSFKP